MVEKTEGERTTAEIVKRARVIRARHFQNWIEESSEAVRKVEQPEDIVSRLERDFRPTETGIVPASIKPSRHGILYRLTHR